METDQMMKGAGLRARTAKISTPKTEAGQRSPIPCGGVVGSLGLALGNAELKI